MSRKAKKNKKNLEYKKKGREGIQKNEEKNEVGNKNRE
jgi:hypothetical protein